MSNDQRQTENCIVCLRPAEYHHGFVQKQDGERVLAGFCAAHQMRTSPNLIGIKYCFGGYHNSYGCVRRSLENIHK